MKKFRAIIISILLLTLISTPVFAKTKKLPKVIFMGVVQSVSVNEDGKYISVKVGGYLKGCTIYKEELIAIISENTVLLKEKCSESFNLHKKEKVVLKDFKIKEGDSVFMVLDGIMTKSIPPQAPIKAILVNPCEK